MPNCSLTSLLLFFCPKVYILPLALKILFQQVQFIYIKALRLLCQDIKWERRVLHKCKVLQLREMWISNEIYQRDCFKSRILFLKMSQDELKIKGSQDSILNWTPLWAGLAYSVLNTRYWISVPGGLHSIVRPDLRAVCFVIEKDELKRTRRILQYHTHAHKAFQDYGR